MASTYNTNAAIPSLHFCWTVILGVLCLRSLPGWAKYLGFLYPGVTFLAIIITGNHFILDAVAGGLLAGAAFVIVELGLRERFSLSR
jgi:fumarate reductase subunit C